MGLLYMSLYLFYTLRPLPHFAMVFLNGQLNQVHKNQLVSQLLGNFSTLKCCFYAFLYYFFHWDVLWR